MKLTYELNPETLEWLPCNYTEADFVETKKLGNFPGIGYGCIMWEVTTHDGKTKRLMSPLWD